MNTKAFVLLLVGVLVLGGSLGGAFAGGVALGKSQGEETAQNSLPTQTQPSPGQQLPGQLSPEQLEQLRQQFQSGQFGQGSGRPGFGGRGGLTGTIEQIDGNTVIINTPQGPLQATIGVDTDIQMFAEGTLADLQAGLRVTVTGVPGEDGTVEAGSILITPEGTGDFLGGGFFSGDRQQLP